MTVISKRLLVVLTFLATTINIGFSQNKSQSKTSDYVANLKKVTDIMVNDVTSPVAAARYYAYVTLSAYEVQVILLPKKYPSIRQVVNMPTFSKLDEQLMRKANAEQAINFAVLKAGQKLLPSGTLLQSDIDSLVLKYKQKYKNPQCADASLILADSIASRIVAWAKTDGFLKLNNLPRYTPKTGSANWKPTAPSFMAPIEPNWNTIRPFLLDSAAQFKPKPPVAFSKDTSSAFFQLMMETYAVGNRALMEEQDIAMFWDCNPFAVQQIGHVEFGLKKISPGGHWIGITGIACIKNKTTFNNSVLIHALVGLTMHDAFISCWDEKYRSNRVRPETAINQMIDKRWRPLLQTPPFPEYTSGHSVVSTASSVILERIFGSNFAFKDDSEVEFGLPIREFTSFKQAAKEAAISRLYGGIHYRDAVEDGEIQGRNIGALGVKKFEKLIKLLN